MFKFQTPSYELFSCNNQKQKGSNTQSYGQIGFNKKFKTVRLIISFWDTQQIIQCCNCGITHKVKIDMTKDGIKLLKIIKFENMGKD